jgi:glycosyltransferase involved in cell wall biosynthesis
LRRLKVVHVITGLGIGGAETMLHKLVSGMDRERFENVVVSLIAPGPMGERIEALGVHVYTLGMQRGRLTPQHIGRLYRLLRRESPDILQTWMYHANLIGVIAGRLACVPQIVWNLRCSDCVVGASRTTVWTFKVCARLSRWPSVIIANSEAGRRFHASKGYHARRWAVLPNGFDLEVFKPDEQARCVVRRELGLAQETCLVGLVGRYDPPKDHANFLRAAMLLSERQPEVHFLLAGRGVVPDNSELMGIVGSHSVRERLHLLGERSDMPTIMAALDVLVSSSSSEGFPNVIGEAMCCGVPCVVTDVGDSARMAGDCGVVVPPRDPGAIADGVEVLLGMETSARQSLGMAARRRMAEQYNLPAIVRRYEGLYDSLANRSSGG